jgi:hypothetical protein
MESGAMAFLRKAAAPAMGDGRTGATCPPAIIGGMGVEGILTIEDRGAAGAGIFASLSFCWNLLFGPPLSWSGRSVIQIGVPQEGEFILTSQLLTVQASPDVIQGFPDNFKILLDNTKGHVGDCVWRQLNQLASVTGLNASF